MTPLLLQRPQPSRNSVSPLVEATKPNLEPRLTHRGGLSRRLGRGHLIDVPAGGWRRFGGPPPAKCGGWWDQIGVRPCRPGRMVPSYGCLSSGLNSRLGTPLRRLGRPPGLPGSIERHLPHLAHPVLRRPRDDQRLVDPRLELVQGRNRAPGDDPVVRVVPLRSLDTRENTVEEGGKSALLLDLRPPFPRTETRGAP